MRTKGIYVAPRITECTDLTFLEAMAQGKLIIANNKPAMNEYITHGETGILCNLMMPSALNLEDEDNEVCVSYFGQLHGIRQIQRNTYEYAKAGYGRYIEQRKRIIGFINAESKEVELKFLIKVLFPLLLLFSVNRRQIFEISKTKG